MSNPIKRVIDRRLQELMMSERLKAQILVHNGQRQSKSGYRRLTVPAIVMLLFLLVGTAVAAIPAMGYLLGLLGQEYEPYLQPVSIAAVEDSGIRMEVLAALNDEERIEVYMKLTDLEGERLQAGMRSYMTCWGAAHLSGNHYSQPLDYDAQEKTLYLKSEARSREGTVGENVTIELYHLLGASHERRGYILGNVLEEAAAMPQFAQAEAEALLLSKTDAAMRTAEGAGTEAVKILAPDVLDIPVPGQPWLTISNIGYIDGALHVQTKRETRAQSFTLYMAEKRNSDSIVLRVCAPYSFQIGEKGILDRNSRVEGVVYQENVFALPETAELADYELLADFLVYETIIPGQWIATVPLTPLYEARQVECHVPVAGGGVITKVYLTPLGLILEGTMKSLDQQTITVQLKDGSSLDRLQSRWWEVSIPEEGAEPSALKRIRYESAWYADESNRWAKRCWVWPVNDMVSITIDDEVIMLSPEASH